MSQNQWYEPTASEYTWIANDWQWYADDGSTHAWLVMSHNHKNFASTDHKESSSYTATQMTSDQTALMAGTRGSPIQLQDSPTFVILDSGCTRSMGSRYAVNRFCNALWHRHSGQSLLTVRFEKCHNKFSLPIVKLRR